MSSFWDTPTTGTQPVTPVGGEPSIANMPMPSFGMANSTQAIPDASTPNISPKAFWDFAVKEVTPRKEPVQVRRPFEATPIETTLPPIITQSASFGTGLLEAIPRGIATLFGEGVSASRVLKGQQPGTVDLGIDMRRLGFTDPKYLTAAQDVQDATNKGENVWQAGLRVMSQKTLDVAFGAQLFSGIAKTLTAQLLKGDLASRVTAQDIVDGYKARQSATFEQLKDAPLKVREKALADLANTKTQAEKLLAEKGAPTTADRARVATARYTEPLARETPIVKDFWNPTKVEVTSYPSRMAQPNIGMNPTTGGGFWDTPVAGLLPGERPLGGKAPQPAFGLSVQPVEKVGGETPQMIANRMAKEYKPVNEIAGELYQGGHGLTQKEATKIATDAVTVKVAPLTTDPASFKTAEEFVKAQEPVYHGADQRNIDALNKNGVKILSADEKLKLPSTGGGNYGVSMTTDKATAQNYSQALGNKNIGEFYLNPSAKVKTISGYIDEVYTPAQIEKLATQGYDAIKSTASENEVRILTNKGALTKSQLTDIWNKAHATKAPAMAKEVSNLPAKVVPESPTKSTSPENRTPQPPEKKVSPQQKATPKLGKLIPQKSEKGGIVAPVRNEKPLQKAYTPKEQKAIQGIADNFKEPITRTQKRLDTLRKIKDDVVEFIQNKETRVLKLVEQKGVKITDSSDPYLKATLYPGKVDTLIKTGHAEGQAIVNEAKTLATSLKKDLADVRKEVNEFLITRHAPERNLALGDKAAGISTAEATAKLEAIKNSPQGAEIAKIADKVQTLNNKVLDILRDGGVISDDLYTTLRTKYKNHIPLNRIFEETDDFAGALSGTGFNVRSTGIKKAVGSQREVSDILGNVLHNYEQAVLRAEKNIVDNATLAFVRANESNLFEIVKPKMVGTDFAGKPLMQTTTDPSILQMFENGKKVWIKINDPKLSIALQGLGKEKLGTILNAVGSFTRLYAGLATRFNPEFALPNKIRDLQETMVYLASRSEVGGKGAFKAVTKDPQSMKDVVDFMRGKDTPGAKLYAEMRSMGGTTGGFGLSTKAKVEMDIKTMEALANSKTRKVVDNLVEYVDNWNTIFEDSTRLSVYKQALEQGLSKERAAFLAKEASINFNRMGKGGPVVNALYMFSNASIQGSAKMIRAMKNPKVAATVATVVGVAVAVSSEWNDQADPEWRDKVPKWDRLNGLPLVIPSTDGTFRYVTIPVSWGIKPIKVSADFAYDMMSGIDYSVKDVAGTLMTTVLESYNPIGGTDMTSALAPTILDVPFDISRNKSWTGKMIKPDFDKNAPEDIKYFESLKKTGTGKAMISLSEMLQQNTGVAISPADMKYAFDSYIGGAGRSVTKTGNALGGLATGKPIPADEYPFISRFYRESQPEETTGKSTEDISALLGQQSRESFKAKQEAISYYDWLKKLPRERANAELDALDIRDPKLSDRVTNLLEEDQLGLTYADKQIKQLQVNNGSRAQYIYDKAMKMKTSLERNAYLDDLTTKKIISATVDVQISELIIRYKTL